MDVTPEQLLRLATEESITETNPWLVAGAALIGVLVGGAIQMLVAYFNRKHERELDDLAVRRQAYAKFRAAFRASLVLQRRTDATQQRAEEFDLAVTDIRRKLDDIENTIVPANKYETQRRQIQTHSELTQSLQERLADRDAAAREVSELATAADTARKELDEAETLVAILATASVRKAVDTLVAALDRQPSPTRMQELERTFISTVREEFGTKD